MAAIATLDPLPTSPTGAGNQEQIWARRAVWLVLGVFVLRIGYCALVPLDLVPDEAYYWDWSRRLDWGYFSKPPMIAWLIRAATEIGGSTTFMVRLPAVILGTSVLAFLYLLAERLYGAAAGFWTVLLAAATPGHAALSLLMTIDAPAICCWSAALYTFWRAYEPPRVAVGWLVASAVAVGLGLLSKQTTIGFLPLAALFLLSTERRRLARPAFWCWCVVALSFMIPVIWWNSQHGWVTLRHTTEHFQATPVSGLGRTLRWGEFVLSILGVSSPLTGFWGAICGGVVLWSLPTLGRRERFLVCFSFVPWIGILGLAAVQRVQPNWPAPFFVAALVMLVGAGLGRCEGLRWRPFFPRQLRQAAIVGIGCTVLTCLAPFGWGLAGSRFDPVVRLRGWRKLGQQVGGQLAAVPDPTHTVLVAVTARDAASELAFYVPQQPPVYLWNADASIDCQYDVWGPPDAKARAILFVTYADSPVPVALAAGCGDLQDRGVVQVEIGNGRSHRYRLWYTARPVNWAVAGRDVRRS